MNFFSSLSFGMSNLQVIAEHLSVEEVAGIKEGFDLMDTNKRGRINMEELRAGLHKLGHQIPDADVQILMEAVSMPVFWNHAVFNRVQAHNETYTCTMYIYIHMYITCYGTSKILIQTQSGTYYCFLYS